MPEGWMDSATWNATAEARRRDMARRVFGRDSILRDIPGEVVRPDEWTEPNTNPHGFHTYPTWDRRASVEERANKILMENPGYSPEQAVELAEREIPQYSRSEQRQVAMADYYRQNGYNEDDARELATLEEEDAWRRRERAASAPRQPDPAVALRYHQNRLQEFLANPPRGVRPDVLAMQEAALRRAVSEASDGTKPSGGGGAAAAKPESRTSGANLPLPVDREVPFGSYEGMPPVDPGLDPARVAEVAGPMIASGIPREEAWQRAQLSLLRGPGRGGAPAKAAPPREDSPWAGRPVPEGYDANKVRSLASHYVNNRGMKPEDAWQRALVDASRGNREGTTSTNAELDSRLLGGRGSERMYPNSTVPGVNDATGVPTRVARSLSDAEAAEYNYRSPPREGGVATEGAYEYSQRDQDMMARGFIPVQTPDGVRYMENAQPEGNNAGRPGVPGKRPDLVERGYDEVTVNDVTGRPRRVYQYTAEGADRANRNRPADWGGAKGGTPFAINQRLKALAEQAGVPVEQARQIVDAHIKQSQADDDPSNDIAMGSQAAFQPLRDMAASRSQADKLDRVQRVRRNAMLAGGQPTGGPGGTIAATNALSMLPQDWQNQVIANRLTGGDITGSTPLDVQGNQFRLGNRLVTAEALSGAMDGSREMRLLEMQMEDKRAERTRNLRAVAATAAHGAWGSREAAARRALEIAGASAEEIDAIMNDLGSGDAPAVGSPRTGTPAAAIPVIPPAASTGDEGSEWMPPVRGGRIPGF